jgi:hypothetical protein
MTASFELPDPTTPLDWDKYGGGRNPLMIDDN